jgi:hypothetical protein
VRTGSGPAGEEPAERRTLGSRSRRRGGRWVAGDGGGAGSMVSSGADGS